MRYLLLLAWLIVSVPLSAQRSFTATYDSERRVTLQGTVTRLDWANPRAFFFIDVRDSNGAVTNWALEFGNIFDLERAGWSDETLQVGEQVTVEGVPARGPRLQAFARSIVRTRNSERIFAPAPNRPAPAAEPAPRWPDGRVSLGPPQGKKGYWGAATAAGLAERTNPPVPMNADAILDNISDADRVAPFQPWAKALYLRRQRRLLEDDPVARCVPPGGPRQFHTPHGIQFVEQRELNRIHVFLGGGNRNWRVINTDGRPVAQAAEVVRTFYGTSVGRWEGNTLVVETVGFNEKFWFSAGGLPHTEALQLTERFTRTDLNTLTYEVTVNDPDAYTRPWTGGWTLRWVPDEEIQEYFCEENVESTFVR